MPAAVVWRWCCIWVVCITQRSLPFSTDPNPDARGSTRLRVPTPPWMGALPTGPGCLRPCHPPCSRTAAAAARLRVLMPRGCRPVRPPAACAALPLTCSWGPFLQTRCLLGHQTLVPIVCVCTGTIPLVSIGWHPPSSNTHADTDQMSVCGRQGWVWSSVSTRTGCPYLKPLPYPIPPSLFQTFCPVGLHINFHMWNELSGFSPITFCPLLIIFLT